MAESLKAQRERVALGLCYRGHERGMERVLCSECRRIDVQLRALQRQAMEALLADLEYEQQPDGGWRGVPWNSLEVRYIDSLLDGPSPEPHRMQEPPPHHPPRCIRCGLHEGIGHPGNHLFQPQSPRCHRAHPHEEPCA